MGEFHSPKSASGAPKWSRCPGSIEMEARMKAEGFVDTGSDYADEGTAAHTVGALCLTTGKSAFDFLGEQIPVGDKTFEVTREMAVAVQEYVDAILEIGADHRIVEERVSFDRWVPGNSGTADCISFKDGTVWVDDYKHGQGVGVDAVDNEQLVLYGAGVIETYDFAFEMHTFVLRIHQPRAGGMTEWVLTREELLREAEKLKQHAEQADSPDAPLSSGDKQCQFCKASPRCPARLLDLLAAVTGACSVPQLTIADVDLLQPEQLAKAMFLFEPARKWMKKAEGYAQGELAAGRPFPMWKLIEGEGRSKWRDDEAVKADFEKRGFDRKNYIVESVIGITDAKKLLPKVDRANFVATHAEKPKGAPKLVPVDHPADPLNSVSNLLDEFE